MSALLEARGITAELGGASILKDVSLNLGMGELLMVIGPNGSGKTTLVRAIMGTVPHGGAATLDGQRIAGMKERERARRIGVLTQQNAPQFAFTAYDCVAIGRYAHKNGMLEQLSAADRAAIGAAFAMTRTEHLQKRLVTTLSGGELQRVCLARTLAQEPDVLILDEPTNHLDIEHQILLFEIIKDWIGKGRRCALAIVHDLNLAYTYGTRALLLNRGEVYASGTPDEVFSKENLKAVYNVDLVKWMRGLLSRWGGNGNE